MMEQISSADFAADPEVDFKVLLEDPDFLVVEKNAGIHVHPLKADEKGTLYQGVISRYPEIASIGNNPREGGLLHRLDQDTSGSILFARNQKAYDFLKEEFKKRRITKEYIALVSGKVSETNGHIEIPIAHHQKNSKKMICVKNKGIKVRGEAREAVTYYELIDNYPEASLLKIQIPTGVRHQIRVHMAFLGHPILGDLLYGMKTPYPFDIPRLFLHASRLEFRHPQSPHPLVKVESALPADLNKVLQNLSATKSSILR